MINKILTDKFRFNKGVTYLAKAEFIHIEPYNHSSAFEKNEEIKIRLSVPYNVGAKSIELIIYTGLGDEIFRLTSNQDKMSRGAEFYEFLVAPNVLEKGIYFAEFSFISLGDLYISSGCYDDVTFEIGQNSKKKFQITVTDFKYVLPKSKIRGIIYHVFVDRFARGVDFLHKSVDKELSWDNIPEYPVYPGAPIKNNTFFGGSLYGVIEKLEYIKSLGASVIYLSPIFLSPSNHRYDTSDYLTVDPMVGGDIALELLIKEAERRDIGIILDAVFNHTGDDSIYFNKYGRFKSLGAYQSEKSPYNTWYSFKDFPNEYECWWGIKILPRINPDVPECRNFFVGLGGVVEKYSRMGILGLRLDVADELSDDFIKDIKKTLCRFGDKLLYGEVWEDGANKIAYGHLKTYYLGDELDGVMNYPLRAGLLDYVINKRAELLKYALCEVFLNAPMRISYAQMNLLGSHDTKRIITELGAPFFSATNSKLRTKRLNEEQRARASRQLIAIYAVTISLPGIPMIYYGDEVGLEGYSDPFNRMPYPWENQDKKILEQYIKLGNLRAESEALISGDFELLLLNEDLLVFKREYLGERLLVVFNNSNNSYKICFDENVLSLLSSELSKKFILNENSTHIYKINDYKKFIIKGN